LRFALDNPVSGLYLCNPETIKKEPGGFYGHDAYGACDDCCRRRMFAGLLIVDAFVA
jgi:hypothetical protein